MVKKIVKRITAWSYSRFSTYKQCPLKAKLKYIDKLPDPSGPAAARGTDIHKTLEDYVSGKAAALPKELHRHKKRLDQWRKLFKTGKVHLEQEWAFDKDFKTTGWFAANCWQRVKMDLVIDAGKIVNGIDHKTGKYRPGEYTKQMQQYCAAMLLRFPKAQEAHVELMFHDLDAPPVKAFLKRAYLEKALEKIRAEVEPMLNDTRFAPMPGPLCKWCNFSKTKDGPCKVA